jgi:DNA-binding HxlR family transcriptional regulator
MKKKEQATFSSVMRILRKKHPKKILQFLKIYKELFDQAIQEQVPNFENLILLESLKKLIYE